MIKTARQLKDLIRNMAQGDSGKSQLYIRNYAMERFLERLAESKYSDNFLLKGGMLISALVGLDNRSTMDIDTTMLRLPLDVEHAQRIVADIIAIELDDGMSFTIKEANNIMDDAEYGGVRLSLDAFLENTRIPLKIDISTGDAVTPGEIEYRYQLMFEQRSITLWAYTVETVLAEKIETLLTRTTFNTRLRDFYDLYILQQAGIAIDTKTLAKALHETCSKRNSVEVLPDYRQILEQIESSTFMQDLWINYQRKNDYASDIAWETVMKTIRSLCDQCISDKRL